ncbi:hypothetical protein BDF14DRAFT_1781156 [Spinellus fusiger]|nr:hypothetical protein BDF14DRAFT_1781156 [Spinellus fusiger]
MARDHIAKYVDAFRDAMLDVPNMTNAKALDKFVRGLCTNVRTNLLREAMRMALAHKNGSQIGQRNMFPSQGFQPFHPSTQPTAYHPRPIKYSKATPMDLDPKSLPPRTRTFNSKSQDHSGVACFWCKKTGHMKCNCQARLNAIKKLDEDHQKKQDFQNAQL